MRIIAGQWRGRQIEAPEGDNTRPILDRAKTVLFDVLGNRLAEPGHLPPMAVLDLFAGSGAMGLEALSRGARYCLFVERHRPTAALLRRNLDTLKIVDGGHVVEADAARFEIPPPPQSEISNFKSQIPSPEFADAPQSPQSPNPAAIGFAMANLKPQSPAYELIFLDPPYRLLESPTPDRSIRNVLTRLATHPAIAPTALIVVRHPLLPPGGEPDLSPLIEQERRDVGTMTFRFMMRPV